jgi:uncharacterized protein DUF3300
MRTKEIAMHRKNRLVTLAVVFSLAAIFAFQAAAQDQGQYNPPPPPPPADQSAPPPQQAAPPPAPNLNASQLDNVVARIALYPDPLLAQVLAASTYPDQLNDANAWANEHANLKGDALANAIREDNLQWDPSVIALLPFPSVLNMMAQDPQWTQQLGDAVLAQRAELMDAVQRQRKTAQKYGYLATSPYDRVIDDNGYVEITPVNPAYIYVPAYDPYVVFGPPRPGFFVGGAIRFGPGIVIGASFAPWGWGHPYFGWGAHAMFFDDVPWGRAWVNRGYYAHPYAHPWAHGPGPRVERHDFGRRR